MSQILPILKEAGYRQDERLFFKERLFDSSAAPMIAFGTDEGNRISYEAALNEDDFNNRLPVIKQQAFDNLKLINPQIDVQDAEGTKIAFITGSEYASEKILDIQFMKSVAQKVGCDNLMVGIPFKGNLIATDANSNIKFKFPAIIKKYYDNPQDNPISDKIFLVQNGEITAMAGEEIKDEFSDKFIVSESNSGEFNIELKSNNQKALFEDINEALDQTVSLLMARKQLKAQFNYFIPDEINVNCKLIVDLDRYAADVEKETLNRITIIFRSAKMQIAPTKINDGNIEERIQFPKFSEQELIDEFYSLTSIPNAHTNASAITLMAALTKEFKSRGLEIPDPNAKPADGEKKWWQFWK